MSTAVTGGAAKKRTPTPAALEAKSHAVKNAEKKVRALKSDTAKAEKAAAKVKKEHKDLEARRKKMLAASGRTGKPVKKKTGAKKTGAKKKTKK